MLKSYLRCRKTALSYLKSHPEYNATIHMLGGVSIGILITGPLINPHPLRWGLIFGLLSIGGHLLTLRRAK